MQKGAVFTSRTTSVAPTARMFEDIYKKYSRCMQYSPSISSTFTLHESRNVWLGKCWYFNGYADEKLRVFCVALYSTNVSATCSVISVPQSEHQLRLTL